METKQRAETKSRIEEAKIDAYARELAENGVVAVPSYLDTARCAALKQEIEAKVENGSLRESDGRMSYQEMAGQDEPVLDRRGGGYDTGMLDIFNMQYAIPELESIKSDPDIAEIINRAGASEYAADNLNIYHNRSVTDTHGYHADSFSDKFKAFVYLTDVPDLSFGPYSYIKGTHDLSRLHRKATVWINKMLGRPNWEAIFYRKSRATNFTAPKGTLIVSNQRGFHRGQPQQEGRERMLVSTSYHAR